MRLAKKLSSTNDSLKRAISRFNTHTRDEFEGTLYKLPHSIHWQNLVDLEEIELSTHPGVIPDVALLNSAVRTLQMRQRAEEEIRDVKEDMRRSADFYTAEYHLIHAHLSRIGSGSQSRYSKGCLNLLCHRLFKCEITLTLYSKMFHPYISYEYPACSLISSMHNEICTEDQDTTELEHISQSASEDSSESDSSSDEHCI